MIWVTYYKSNCVLVQKVGIQIVHYIIYTNSLWYLVSCGELIYVLK